MFLNTLNNEEKTMFIDMAVHVSQSNGIIEEKEQSMLDLYCNEMGINSYNRTELHSIDEIKTLFSSSSESAKRIAVFELLGLGYMDGNYDELETSIIKDFATSIGLTKETYNRLNRDIEDYTTVLGFIQNHIFGNSISE